MVLKEVHNFNLSKLLIAQRLVICGLTVSSLSFASYGANAAESQTDESNVQQVILEPIVVNASSNNKYSGGQVAKTGKLGFLGNKTVKETPFNTVNYTDKYVEDTQAKDITDVISKTDPSVFTNNASGGWSENYYIRGFNSSSSDMTVNGMIGMAPFYRTSPEMYESIEVLKGPSALLNGMPPKGSVGGTINLMPKRAAVTPLTRLTATYMSDSQFGGHVDVGRRFGEQKQFGMRFNGVYRDGNGAVKDQDKKTGLAALGVDWQGQKANLSLDLYDSKDHVDGVTRGLNLAPNVTIPKPPKPDTLINPAWSYVDNKDKGVMVRGEYNFDNVTAYAAYGKSKSNYEYNGAMTAQLLDKTGKFKTSMGQLAFEIEKQSADVGVKGNFNTGDVKHQWVANVTHYKHDENDYGRRTVPGADWTTNLYNPVWGPSAPLVLPHITQTGAKLDSYGIADTMSFNQDKIQLTLGARHQQVVSDNYNITTGALTSRYDKSATSPGAALLYKLDNNTSLYANYIQGLSQGATAPATAANAGEVFEPYKTKQIEVGTKFDIGKVANTLSVFEIKLPTNYTDPVTNIFSSGGEQRNRGVEWSFIGKAAEKVRVLGGLGYLDPKLTRTSGGINQGNMATGVPKYQGKLGAEWDIPNVEGLTLTANALAVSKQYINAANTLSVPGRTTYDVGARYNTSLSGRPVSFKAAVNNVTNKAYWGMPQLASLTLGAPRTYLLSASVDF